jgi:hypothetical protein
VLCASTSDKEGYAKTAKVVPYASTRGKEATVKTVKEVVFATIASRKANAKTVEEVVFVSTRGNELHAQIVKEVLYATTTKESIDVKSVWLQHHVWISLIESKHEIYSSSNIIMKIVLKSIHSIVV